MNVLKCQCSQQMGLRRDFRYFDIYRDCHSPEKVLWGTICPFYPVQPNPPFLPLPSALPSFLPSFLPSLKSISPSIFPTPPTHFVWKHQSILCCIDYCTLALSRWTALIHHTHGAVCQQHQSIFHFHNRERRGEMESGRKTKDWMRAGERTK